MDDKQWLSDYFELYRESLFGVDVRPQLVELTRILKETHARGKKTIIAGNGGSASISSHCAVDITKNAGVRCVNFNEADLITCFANDYGYELWLEKAMEFYADEGDVAVLISSSGKSPNMLRAGQFALDHDMKLVTFTGMEPDNPLRQMGHLNLWVDSRAYNIVEMTHHIWLLAVCDLIIGSAEYSSLPSR